jgi:S-DNA-T family DNA segregation ATPase FtsK/SpoIIIE
MERRFELIESKNTRNITQYNAAVADDPTKESLPQIVIIIDELADLMMSAPDDVEASICRLAQKARAAGMHLIIGTQRPSVDVITGLIKANIPSRIAFTVASQIDSRTIIDTQGAEKLIGRGDMLYAPVGASKPVRVQGAFVSETEIEEIIGFIRDQKYGVAYSDDVMSQINKAAEICGQKKGKSAAAAAVNDGGADDNDPMLDSAIELAVECGKISTSLIQRRLQLGYGRAAKIIDMMERRGIVSAPEGQKPRAVLITREQYLEMKMNCSGQSKPTGDTMF